MIPHLLVQTLILALSSDASPTLICCGAEEVFTLQRQPGQPDRLVRSWTWTAADSPEIPEEARSWFRSTDECKPLGDSILIASSSGGVALIRRRDKRCFFYTFARNAHSVCMLPKNRIAVASSNGGDELLLYAVGDAAEQAEAITKIPLDGAHGVVWDSTRKRLWALGTNKLLLVDVREDGDDVNLITEREWELPSPGGHDLSTTRDKQFLYVTTSHHVYQFNKDTASFSLDGDIGNNRNVKSVAQHPITGDVVYHQGTPGHWWSDTIRFTGKRAAVRISDERLYKVRWDVAPSERGLPWRLAGSFAPPDDLATELGDYRSPLKFYDGSDVRTAEDWQRRRQKILDRWHETMGAWPPLLKRPGIEYVEKESRDNLTQHRVQVEVASGMHAKGYLLIPDGDGPHPAAVVPYYDAETGAGLKTELRDFGYQLARRGFVTLSIGGVSPRRRGDVSDHEKRIQPLSFMAYAAANCHTLLGQLDSVDSKRIGIVGHSYGGKWAMFASCLYDRFACAAWSDGGIVFDEKRANVNYWEPWYLGFDPTRNRKAGIPNETNPRTGAYATMIEQGRDLHELHALMAPRPFLVSGGSEDLRARWVPLNHSIAVNRLLGYRNRVAMTNRPRHSPNHESNEQIYSFFEHFLNQPTIDRKPDTESSD